MEDTPIDTVNVENPMTHHMWELKPTPRWGFGFRYIVKYKTLGGSDQDQRPQFLRGNGFRQTPKDFKCGKTKVL